MAAISEPLRLERDVCRAIELLEKLQRSGEVPPPKLQALQRVLQSKFCAAIREVYEQLYDTLDISGGAEIRAQATAKATVAAFAAATPRPPSVVELPKSGGGARVQHHGGQRAELPHLHLQSDPGGRGPTRAGLRGGPAAVCQRGGERESRHY
ncbi:hypothetical protein AOXY_G31698 [Acipenser oxyrinchus oxyrinchus]|uniref:L27 domain-containing protein n=1 Tax=Acipenser oxyrinchus oxyrinchus TaxID=40147 RepID=A0AAD8FPE6_ACIOX|nr:hypothetical protein AOXY_G31698 [Acipenser oxyrinchus oxyrinchus]